MPPERESLAELNPETSSTSAVYIFVSEVIQERVFFLAYSGHRRRSKGAQKLLLTR